MKWILNITFMLLAGQSIAQEARMMFRNPQIRIGEQTGFVLSLEYQDPEGDDLIAWPQFDQMLTDYIEIIDRTVDFTEIVDSSNHIYQRKQEFTITCFEPGIHQLQPIGIELNDSMYFSSSTGLMVETVQIDTSKSIFDIKENYSVDYTFTEKMEDWFVNNWPYLAATAGAIALFFLIMLIRNRRPEKIEPEAPPIPAHITALKNLLELKKKEAWRTDNHKQYYSELTYTVRLYLEQRFGIQAIEHTTREIINDLKFADISEEDKVYLRKILSEADMVKFAKMVPQQKDGEESLDKSINFVERTKKEETTEHTDREQTNE